ncbi:hypothetical protein [uncultured Hoeflea sp.]|uniref:hypothetical protein n=1 Tax=uncultured Hoeflea sp. TaxID=538666 RepID=UPI0030DA6A84|tara:strand:- start:1583 stop:1864 length:282 start_codon:yes stop_codon:yes gene_type:complete
MHKIKIRQSLDTDMPAIERLYPAAFPDEDLLPLVRHLLTGEPDILSLVAEAGQSIAGHVLSHSAVFPAAISGPHFWRRSPSPPGTRGRALVRR